MARLLPALAAGLLFFGVGSGCSHYRLGTAAPLPFATLFVSPTSTKILLPQGQAIITTQLRAAFLRDSRVTLVNSPEAADATLDVEITDYRRDVATQRRDDTGLARKFSLQLTARGTLKDNRSGKVYFAQREIIARRDVYTDSQFTLPAGSTVSGQLQSEYQALPLLAEALAEKVTHAALDVW
jgi:Lipopolysaccharide-assembly